MSKPALLIALAKKAPKEGAKAEKRSQRREDMLAALRDFDESKDPEARLSALDALIEMRGMDEDG